ncbi:putative nuclear RNA export factor SDE5 isoform X2 [Hevea brasiliensis]|uniref:putative nuclear RNA export factor SDE5 isoform X2 n=1 Tax=Hevea brasiliensis TaxID=3981 RepID=UPI0025D2391B|nr:putative nuclear RNA export factor SDE5 isoform X2 [Hevea brasiliensis]
MHAISSTAQSDVNKKDLEELLEVFGSAFSLDDIASAYCQGRRDTNLAAEILCGMHGTTSTTVTAEKLADENATPLIFPFVSERTRTLSKLSSEWPSDNHLEKTSAGQNRTKELRSKKCSISMGTVSSVIGKEYAKPRPLTYESTEARKPLKLDSKDFPVSEIWSEKNPSSVTTRNKISQVDIEEFLFKMLGEGFQLDMPVIREVLDHCGYDMQKSTEKFLEQESVPLHQQVQQLDSAQSDVDGLMVGNLTGSPKKEKDRIGLQKEVLQALFDFSDRSEEAPKITCQVRVVKRSKAFGKLVVECPKDATREHKPSTAEPQVVTGKDEEDDNSYEVLRIAVKEHRNTMKEYYKAAIDAFVKGDHARAHKLLEQGQFFNKKAREADDKSCQKLIETRDDEVVSVKLHDLEPKESLDLMRRHLTSLCGIPSIKYLRVIMESNGEDTTKGKRKKLIMKQLEKESIEWNEEENGKTILIKVDVIDPKRLSFAKKYGVGNDNKRGPTPANVGYHF